MERICIYFCGYGALAFLLAACNPTVKVEAPDKPIVVNMNVKIEHEVKVRLKKEVKKAIAANPDLF